MIDCNINHKFISIDQHLLTILFNMPFEPVFEDRCLKINKYDVKKIILHHLIK